MNDEYETEVEFEGFESCLEAILTYHAHWCQGYAETLQTPAEPAGYEVEDIGLVCDWAPLLEELECDDDLDDLIERSDESEAWGQIDLDAYAYIGGARVPFTIVVGRTWGDAWQVIRVTPGHDAEEAIELYLQEQDR